MANESFANLPLVEVDGNPLPADVAALLTYAYVDASRNLPDMCALRFRDPQRLALQKGRFTIGAKLTIKVNTAEPGGPVVLMSGEVTAMELDLDKFGNFTEVRGHDLAHRLFRGRRVAAYPDMGIADVVRKVVQRAGVTVGQIDAVPGVGGAQHTQFSQDNITDWEFLTRLAHLVGAQVTASEGKLDFCLPDPPAGAPAANATATTDPLVLEANRNLISLRASLSAAEQVPSVEARGWDFEHKQELTATATPTTPGTEVTGAKPVEMANKFKAPPYLAATAAYHGQGEVKAAANALAAQLGSACAELDGVAKGNPKFKPGVAVALTNVGDPFGGKYTLTSTRHLFSVEAGYTTAFTVSHRQERSLYGLVKHRGDNGTGSGSGLMPGIVSDVKDPLKLGRVKLTFPWLSKDYTSGWARVLQGSAGKDRGTWLLPEVGDEVLVGSVDGDPDTLYVLGGLHNGKDTVPTLSAPAVDAGSGEIGVRAIVSRKGHRLELVDAPGKESVLLSTGDKKLVIKMDVTGNKVEITSEGTVEVTSKGQMKLTGMGITVDAGSGALELKGNQVKATGQAAAEFTASGPVTVKGAIVKIN